MAKTIKETRYMFKRHSDGVSYNVIKMKPNGEAEQMYKLNERGTHCDCPAHVYCRHQKMLIWFKEQNHIGDGWSVIFETGEWIAPEKIDGPGSLYEGMFDDDETPTTQSPHLIDL